VLHELLVTLPHEDFVYLGDSARFPYGERSPEELERFGMDIAEELVARRAKLLVVACNSMTAAALPALQRRMLETTLGVDVIGVVAPEAAQAVAVTHSGRIGLLATRATVASGAYERAVARVDPHVDVVAVACPELAPLIQDPPGGDLFTRELQDVVRASCAPLAQAGVDTVILGCTHYPLVRPMLQRMLGRGVTIVTSGAALARQAEHALRARGLASQRSCEGTYAFLCTGDEDAFRALGTRFLQMPLTEVEHVDLVPITMTTEVAAWSRP
jgi:glutamate racemase